MRASVHIKLPNLTSDGTDAKAKEVCNPLGLSVRGTGGEHTPIGADGTVDISPRARLFIKERDIIQALFDGISKLMVKEKEAAPAEAHQRKQHQRKQRQQKQLWKQRQRSSASRSSTSGGAKGRISDHAASFRGL